MSLLQLYERLGPSVRLEPERAASIVAAALPHAVSALGGNVKLDVHAAPIGPKQARGGSLIPAWPHKDASGGVTIDYVDDWGVLLSAWVSSVQPAEQALALDLVRSGERVWIGIANDVLQVFVQDPPEGTYSMVRHHALMLTAATIWLGSDAVSRWRRAHAGAAQGFLRRHGGEPLWSAIDAAERGLGALLSDPRGRQPAPDALGWLEADSSARTAYLDYLGAASLGVAAALEAMLASSSSRQPWLGQAVAEWHADPDFNRAWIEACVARLNQQLEVAR
jgi:hypothetical protein